MIHDNQRQEIAKRVGSGEQPTASVELTAGFPGIGCWMSDVGRWMFPAAFRAFFTRELRTVVRNRFLQVFSALALLVGWAAVGAASSSESTPFILLQVVLYLVPLFAILIGISSAHGELEEYSFLFSQPVPRFALVAGKWAALLLVSAVVLFLAFLPALCAASAPGKLLLLWAQSLCLSAVFLSIGLAIGVGTLDRARGIIYGLVVWLMLLIGFDVAAFLAAQSGWVQSSPGLWVSLLLANPVDAVRVHALLALEEIPFALPGGNSLVTFWIAHLGPWVLILSVAWTAAILFWCRRKVEAREI